MIAVGGRAVDIRANIRLETQARLKSFNKNIVDVAMGLNEAIYTICRDDARVYKAVSKQNFRPSIAIFTNLFAAGRKGDSAGVRRISKMYLDALERLKRKIKAGKIKLVTVEELVRDLKKGGLYIKENFEREVEFAKNIKSVQTHPQEFCRAMQIAFSLEYNPHSHSMTRAERQ